MKIASSLGASVEYLVTGEDLIGLSADFYTGRLFLAFHEALDSVQMFAGATAAKIRASDIVKADQMRNA